MKRPSLARYFIASVLLLLIVVSAYGLSESRRLQLELLRQAEAKVMALAEAMEASAKNAILGNSLLEEMVSQTSKRKRCLGSSKSSTFVDQKVEPVELKVFRLTALASASEPSC